MAKKYRLALGLSIKKDDWYLGVKCKGCSNEILCLNDPQKGETWVIPLVDGMFSIPCQQCGNDDIYAPTDLKQFQAKYDCASFRDARPDPSKMQKYPFLPRHRNLHITFGPGAIEHRPEIMKVMARIVVYWTSVETEMARLLSVLMEANTEPAIAVYLSLKTGRQKTEVLNAAASSTLAANDYELFQAIIQWNGALAKERNDIAHGVFGVCFPLKDAVVWQSTTDSAINSTKIAAFGVTDSLQEANRKKVWVYEIGTLERIALEIEDLCTQVGFFLGYLLNNDPSWRATRYLQLCSAPRIRKELTKMQKAQQNKP